MAALGALVLGHHLFWPAKEVAAPRPGIAPAPPAPADRASDATAPARGSGVFGTPLAREDRPEPRQGVTPEEDEDLPVAGAPTGKRAARRQRRAERGAGGVRSRDRYTVFESDAVTSYATGTRSTVDDVPLSGEAGTVSFWLQPAWDERSHDDASFVVFGDGALRVLKNVSFVRFEVVDEAGNMVGLGAPIGEWRAGEWHQVVATWDGRVIWLYVDGALVSTGAQSGPIDLPPGTPVHIGSAFPEGRPVAPGQLAGVTIRTRALTPNAVAKRFMTGVRPEG